MRTYGTKTLPVFLHIYKVNPGKELKLTESRVF